MNDIEWAKRVTELTPREGRRPRRLKKRWRDEIEKLCGTRWMQVTKTSIEAGVEVTCQQWHNCVNMMDDDGDPVHQLTVTLSLEKLDLYINIVSSQLLKMERSLRTPFTLTKNHESYKTVAFQSQSH